MLFLSLLRWLCNVVIYLTDKICYRPFSMSELHAYVYYFSCALLIYLSRLSILMKNKALLLKKRGNIPLLLIKKMTA